MAANKYEYGNKGGGGGLQQRFLRMFEHHLQHQKRPSTSINDLERPLAG